MKLNTLVISSLIAIVLTVPATAKEVDHTATELASPIVSLMPIVIGIRDELDLNDAQNKTIDAWLAEAPGNKKKLQQDVLKIRADLRAAILDLSSRIQRDELKVQLNQVNTRLIELSSLCIRMLHDTLTTEQYARVVTKYKKANQS